MKSTHKSTDRTVVTIGPQLNTRRLEVNASPMLGLIELRYREPDGTVSHEFVDRGEARKLATFLLTEIGVLDSYWHGLEAAEEAAAAPAREDADAALHGRDRLEGRVRS